MNLHKINMTPDELEQLIAPVCLALEDALVAIGSTPEKGEHTTKLITASLPAILAYVSLTNKTFIPGKPLDEGIRQTIIQSADGFINCLEFLQELNNWRLMWFSIFNQEPMQEGNFRLNHEDN